MTKQAIILPSGAKALIIRGSSGTAEAVPYPRSFVR